MTSILSNKVLDKLVIRFRLNAPYKTVRIMSLLQNHPEISCSEEIEKSIAVHSDMKNPCSCGLKSTGTVHSFAKALWEAQYKAPLTENPYDLDTCFHFMHALYCVAPLKGQGMEKNSQKSLSEMLGEEYSIRKVTHDEDYKCGIDYVVQHLGTDLLGVQVKPVSWKYK